MEHNHSPSVCMRIRNRFHCSSTVSFFRSEPRYYLPKELLVARSPAACPSLHSLVMQSVYKAEEGRGNMHVTMENREVILFAVVMLLETVSHIAQVDWKSIDPLHSIFKIGLYLEKVRPFNI